MSARSQAFEHLYMPILHAVNTAWLNTSHKISLKWRSKERISQVLDIEDAECVVLLLRSRMLRWILGYVDTGSTIQNSVYTQLA